MGNVFWILLCLNCSTLTVGCYNGICLLYYVKKTGLYPVGCNETNMWTEVNKSKLSCARSCIDSTTCTAFVYDGQFKTCSLCQGDLIQELNFTSDVAVYWKIQHAEYNIPFADDQSNSTNIIITLVDDFYTGSCIHLSGYFFHFDGFYINLMQDYSGGNVALHFRSRLTKPNTPNLLLSYRRNFGWVTAARPVISPYPFTPNTSFMLDILVSSAGYLIYIDQIYCCQLPHYLFNGDTKYLEVTGNISIYEIRF